MLIPVFQIVMNLSGLPALLAAWLKGQGAELLQGQRTQEGGVQPFRPGQQYEGRVLENLGEGRSLVRVGRQVLDMALPGAQPRPGEALRLTYLADGPRHTFLLQHSAASAPVRLSDAVQQVAALTRLARQESGAPVQAGAASAAPTRPLLPNPAQLLAPLSPQAGAAAATPQLPALSMAGQMVDGLRSALATGAQLTTQGIGQAAHASQALLPVRLKQVVRESGLFYESHLARWNRGEMGLEEILREPQARLLLGGSTTGLPELGRMPEEAARLASRQLMLLEGAPFVWQGQVWPGQAMEWRIEEREAQGEVKEEAPHWRTELDLTLPRLGRIRARLDITPQGLELELAAALAEGLAEIREALPALAQRLEAAGLHPKGLTARVLDAETTAA